MKFWGCFCFIFNEILNQLFGDAASGGESAEKSVLEYKSTVIVLLKLLVFE